MLADYLTKSTLRFLQLLRKATIKLMQLFAWRWGISALSLHHSMHTDQDSHFECIISENLNSSFSKPSIMPKLCGFQLIGYVSVAVVDLLLFEFLQLVTSFATKRIMMNNREIQELTFSLSSCSQLTSLSLIQTTRHTSLVPGTVESVAKALAALLEKCHAIEVLSLDGFPLSSAASRIKLPTKLKSLSIKNCMLSRNDWRNWTENCSTSTLSDLIVDRCDHTDGMDFDAMLKFCRKHSDTLSYLYLWPGMDGERLSVNLRQMALNLKQLNSLQDFTYCTESTTRMLNILKEVLPSVVSIDALSTFYLWSRWSDTPVDLRDTVQRSIRAICASRRTPLSSGTVRYMS